MHKIVNVIIALVSLFVLSTVVYYVTGLNVQENFSFCRPDDCSCVCNNSGSQDRHYCNTQYYLKDGPAGLCNCQWQGPSAENPGGFCAGSRA